MLGLNNPLLTAAIFLNSIWVTPHAAALARQPTRDGTTAEVPEFLRSAHRRWSEAVSAENPAALALLYAEDVWFVVPDSFSGHPDATVAEVWTDIFALPNMSVSFEPQSFQVTKAGKIAVERGRGQYYHLVGGIPYGTNVSYLRVWRRQRGVWLISDEINVDDGNRGNRRD